MGFDDYTMDSFIEKIVTKKRDAMDRLQIAGAVILGIVLLFATMFIRLPQAVSQFSLFIWAAVFYLIFRFMRSKNIEFEYSVTNGDMDIDKIIAQKKRKRIFSGHSKNYEIVAKMHSDKYNQSYANIPNKVIAVSSLKEEDVYFFVTQYKGQRTIVYFQPSEKMLKSFRTFIPSKIHM